MEFGADWHVRPRVKPVRAPQSIRLALLLALGGVFAACGGNEATAVSTLKTGFESRQGSGWTSLREEQSFLRDLDRASDRLRVAVIGRSVQRRPIRLVTVGPARTPGRIAAGSSVLFVCTQHGTEPAGREACLQAARDAVQDIGSSTLLVIPTANPDGLNTDDRGNADGVDVNRDHAELSTPETRAIAAVLRAYKPDLVADFHEYKEEGGSAVLLSNPDTLHLNVDPSIKELSSRLKDDAARALRAKRYRTGLYPTLTPNANEGVLRQQAALRHSPSLLIETPRRGTLSPLQRVAAHRAVTRATLKMLRDGRSELAGSTAAAARGAIAEGAAGRGRYYYRSPTRHTDRPPCGYLLDDSQYRSVKATFGLHDVAATFAGGSWKVATAQVSQPSVGLLLDARSPQKLTEGDPVAC